MSVFALVTAVGAFPEPSVFLVFNSIQEVFANDFGSFVEVGSILPVFAGNGFFELLLVPVFHGVCVVKSAM